MHPDEVARLVGDLLIWGSFMLIGVGLVVLGVP